MVAGRCLDQILIGLGQPAIRQVAMLAGKIQPNLAADQSAILGEGGDLGRIDGHQVRANVAGELGHIAPGGLDQARHVTLDEGRLHGGVLGVVLDFCLLEMAVFALRTSGLLFGLAKLHDTLMRVVAKDTVQDEVLALV